MGPKISSHQNQLESFFFKLIIIEGYYHQKHIRLHSNDTVIFLLHGSVSKQIFLSHFDVENHDSNNING